MSVPKNDRGDSSMQFIETADEIERYTIEVCKKWPKTYTFLLTNRTVDLACTVYEKVMAANDIMPTCPEEVRYRARLLLDAMGALHSFARKIERAHSLFPICGHKEGRGLREEEEKSNRVFERFMDLCETEESAIKGNLTYTRSLMPKKK